MRRIKCPVLGKPFSHQPGVVLPLPTTDLGLEIFPTGLKLKPTEKWVPFPIQGPVSNFTVELNFERACIKVFGKDQKKYFSYWITANSEKDDIVLLNNAPPQIKAFEKIFLGISKQPDWELVVRRNLILEALPFWFLLSQISPEIPLKMGDSLIQDLELAIKTSDILSVKATFSALWKTGFKGMLLPQAEDLHHLGYAKSPLPKSSKPFSLLTKSYHLIKKLFIRCEESTCQIAPLATSLFTFGTAKDLKNAWGEVSIEWTKHKLRRVDLRCFCSKKVKFTFPKSLKSCRLFDNQTYTQLSIMGDTTLDLQKDCEYFLDHFE